MALAQNMLQSMPELQTLKLGQLQLCLLKRLEKIPASHKTAVLRFWDQFFEMSSCSLHSSTDLLIGNNLSVQVCEYCVEVCYVPFTTPSLFLIWTFILFYSNFVFVFTKRRELYKAWGDLF
jgi:hypothetical protein